MYMESIDAQCWTFLLPTTLCAIKTPACAYLRPFRAPFAFRTATSRIYSRVTLKLLKACFFEQIVISFYQVIASIPIQYEVSWGPDLLNQMTYAAISSISFFQFESFSCAFLNYSYGQKVFILGITVIVVTFLLYVPFLLLKIGLIRVSAPERVVPNVWAQFLFSTTLWLFLVYPSVSRCSSVCLDLCISCINSILAWVHDCHLFGCSYHSIMFEKTIFMLHPTFRLMSVCMCQADDAPYDEAE